MTTTSNDHLVAVAPTQPTQASVPIEIELRPLAASPPSGIRPLGGKTRRRGDERLLFGITVLLPIVAAAAYLFVIAAPRYASEASYIVRSAGAGSGGSGVTALMQTRGVSRAVDETYAINEYMTSPEVLSRLCAEHGLREILNRPEADIFNRYPSLFARENQNTLRLRFEAMLTQTVDEGTGISRLEVIAFRPDDAQTIADALLKYAEEMVNRLNDRAYKDALLTANRFVDQAMAGLRDAETALTTYRDTSGTVDPSSDAAATMRVIQTLTVQLSQLETSVLEQEVTAPQSPQSAGLRQRVAALRTEIGQLKLKLTGSSGSDANKLGRFEELMLRRELAAKSLENAVFGRDKARQEAENQHLYVQVIRAPNLPDVARYPLSLMNFLSVVATSVMLFFVLRSFKRAALEHRI